MELERIEQMRIGAHVIASRAKADAKFREKLFLDPVETLIEAGLPGNAVTDFLREITADVSGYVCQYTCLQTYVS